MARKSWITLKRGLSEDPKHREAMGMAIWAFIHILDRADWETGKVYDWRDEFEAQDMGVNSRTLRDWRNRLSEQGYILCTQKARGLEITIYKWVNPRDYSGKLLNVKAEGDTVVDTMGDTHMSPSTNEGDTGVDTMIDTVVDTGVSRKSVTPTSDSKVKDQRSKVKDTPALDFRNMTVMDAQKLPTLQLYKKAADFFPGSLAWEFVHNEITKHNLTFKQINDAAVAWESRGFKRENVKGILEWAVNGVPKSTKGNDTQALSATFGPAYKPFVPKEETDAKPPSPEVLEKIRIATSKMSANNKRVGVRHDQ